MYIKYAFVIDFIYYLLFFTELIVIRFTLYQLRAYSHRILLRVVYISNIFPCYHIGMQTCRYPQKTVPRILCICGHDKPF